MRKSPDYIQAIFDASVKTLFSKNITLKVRLIAFGVITGIVFFLYEFTALPIMKTIQFFTDFIPLFITTWFKSW